ncbi:hypothetical protein [Sphingopyxis sp. L1A2A]|uniref:hypothetical protein n=1 Tax=Sphingopyxis sp. L1A2A TaxID=2502247 RepID=UPI0010FA50F2|nr:hypothetical protein [Sphingopyxis sp. L1A2A]
MRRIERGFPGVGCALALLMASVAAPALAKDDPAEGALPQPPLTAAQSDIPDPDIRAWWNLTYDRKPPAPLPGQDYGMDAATGTFRHPKATPLVRTAPNFPGQLDHWDQKSYRKNVEVLAFYDFIPSTGHTWQTIVDFGKKRYMYVYYRSGLGIFDITDPRHAKLVFRRGQRVVAHGKRDIVNPYAKTDGFGAANVQWHQGLGKYVMVQAFEVPRYGVMDEKYREPKGVDTLKHWQGLKGFRVYAMDGPLPDQWQLIAERTTDYRHPDAPYGEQQGSGALDIPAWTGGKYMFLSTAPDDRFVLTEFADYIYTPGYQVWDMSDPANPAFVSQFAAPGQILGDPDHEAAYLMNPRAGNRTSWFGSRMPPFMTKAPDAGGKIAFGAMAGLGLYALDVSNPTEIKIVGHVNQVPKFAGTEFDNVDLSQYERTGYIFSNGYPMNDECYEPYKDIFVVDARDPAHLKIAAKFPRPTPPADAGFTDYCQRRGSFGPKRSGYLTQPGRFRDGLVSYAFYNAGVQIFDVKDPTKPVIAGYFVPRFPTDAETGGESQGNLTYGVYAEYDRNILWAFTNHGFYALSSPLLGKPVFKAPERPWPPRP